ncbi:hypothetical protein NB640_09895 [Oxalobacter vibrioformis]|uniref:Uncharacterized protein n=1 Tax=Oxalobacter vibrioformis TaxID=933080 RepID=A0A9E9LVL4_9BURK|nr:hypothetical protein [Oxalobacter vibrioformis]WAW09542.1 hypothetical protein NB640_09895 [Oxalobacter vibrioformis]
MDWQSPFLLYGVTGERGRVCCFFAAWKGVCVDFWGISFASLAVQQTISAGFFHADFAVFLAIKNLRFRKKSMFSEFFSYFFTGGVIFFKSSAGGQLRDIGGKSAAVLSYAF